MKAWSSLKNYKKIHFFRFESKTLNSLAEVLGTGNTLLNKSIELNRNISRGSVC